MRGRRITTFEALRYRNFRWFWINGIAQGMAQGMQFLVLGWLILEITDSAYQLGMVIFSYGMTNIAFSMLGGIMADRIDRLKLLILTRLAVTTPILVLAVLTVTDLVEVWHLYTIALILGTVQALNQPVRIAFVADLVERKDMMNAVSLHALVNQTGQILGPAIGGGFIELAGLGATLFLDAGLYLLGVVFLLMIRGLEPQPPSGGHYSAERPDDGLQVHHVHAGAVYRHRHGHSLCFLRGISPAGHARDHERGVGRGRRRDRIYVVVGRSRLHIRKPHPGVIGRVPAQSEAAFSIHSIVLRSVGALGGDALVLGVMGHFLFRGRCQFRVVLAVGYNFGPTQHASRTQRAGAELLAACPPRCTTWVRCPWLPRRGRWDGPLPLEPEPPCVSASACGLGCCGHRCAAWRRRERATRVGYVVHSAKMPLTLYWRESKYV